MSLKIENLTANIGDRQILKGLNLEVPKGQVHAIMGKNGSGKSTLAKVMAGHPDYEVTGGSVTLDGLNLDRKSTRLNSSHPSRSRMPSSA